VNDHKQSVGHGNAALGLLGTNTGLPGLSSGGWCGLGAGGALCGSGVVRANGALLIMGNAVRPKSRYGAAVAPSEEQTTWAALCARDLRWKLITMAYLVTVQNCTGLEINCLGKTDNLG
jgi:hypothetical protein